MKKEDNNNHGLQGKIKSFCIEQQPNLPLTALFWKVAIYNPEEEFHTFCFTSHIHHTSNMVPYNFYKSIANIVEYE